MPRILVIDEYSVFREGLCSLIESNIPAAEALPARGFADFFSQGGIAGPFDLALLDPGPSGFNSIDAIRKNCEAIAANRLAIISAFDSRENILCALGSGFHGFLSKRLHDDEILEAINNILAGRIYVPTTIAETTVVEADPAPPPMPPPEINYPKLTRRQREVLALLVRGMSNKEIARALGIAESTTKIHTAALIHALGVRNRTEAAFNMASLIRSLKQQTVGSSNQAPAATNPEDLARIIEYLLFVD